MTSSQGSAPLEATLLDLLYELRDSKLPLILGGGYGLLRKQRHIQASGERLLLNAIPPLRSTNDLDLFLQTELFADTPRLKPLRVALDSLGFQVIPSAQNYQFSRKFTQNETLWDVKIDLLTRKPDSILYPSVKFDDRRVKPESSVGVHAHTTPEAIAVEEATTPVTITGRRTNDTEYSGIVYLPSAYAFLMMKLFALNDQWLVERKEFGRKHALDVYTLIAMLTEAEFAASLALRERYRSTPEAVRAGEIASHLFRTADSPGSLRLREHPLYPPTATAAMSEFLSVLADLFP